MESENLQTIKHVLPPTGIALVASYKNKQYTAEIILAPDFPEGKAVKVNNVLYKSLSGAAMAITEHKTNGWNFWKVNYTGHPL